MTRVPLADVCEIKWGDTAVTKASYTATGYPAFSASGCDGFLPYFDHEGPGIVLSAIGAQCGKIWYTEGKWSCIKNTMYIKSRSGDADIRYIFYATSNPGIWPKRGAAQPFISQADAQNIEIELPSISAQRRIAGILSAYDELIQNNQRRIKILEAMARAIYREWFVKFRFPGHESVPHAPSPLGEIPQGWQVQPFSGLATYLNGYAFKPSDWGIQGMPIVKIKELKAGVTAETPRNTGDRILEKYIIQDGDVLFSWSADLDAYLWMGGNGLLNQHLFNVVPSPGFSRAFSYHALKQAMPLFRALSLGATMHHIKRSALDQVFVAVPNEMLRSTFDAAVEPIHQQLISITKTIQNLRRTRDLLLPRLLSGELDVEESAA